MNIYRYKHYDFINDRLPLGFSWKPPQAYGLSPPDSDYELYEDSSFSKDFIKQKYYLNETNGKDLTFDISAQIIVMVENAVITSIEANDYSVAIKSVIDELSKGFYHSAYLEATQVSIAAPTFSPELVQLHNDSLVIMRDYVNSKYPPQFNVT